MLGGSVISNWHEHHDTYEKTVLRCLIGHCYEKRLISDKTILNFILVVPPRADSSILCEALVVEVNWYKIGYNY